MKTNLLYCILCFIFAIVAHANVGYVTAVSPTYKLMAYLNNPNIVERSYGTVEWDRPYKQGDEWFTSCEFLLVTREAGISYYKFERINTDNQYDMYMIPALYKLSNLHSVAIDCSLSWHLWASIITLTEANWDNQQFAPITRRGIVVAESFHQGFLYTAKTLDDRWLEFNEIKDAMSSKCSAEDIENIIRKYQYIDIPEPKIPTIYD